MGRGKVAFSCTQGENSSYLMWMQVGARLISHAGSLTSLAKYPASTVQILGAEKALFRWDFYKLVYLHIYYFAHGSDSEVLWWACLYVCLSVCPRSYLRIHTRDLYQTFCACCIWPWLGPPPAGWRNPKRKWKFWGFSSPLTKHCNAFAANNVMQQKGSFHRCQGVMGVHSAGEVWSINLWLPCFDIGNS